MDNWKMRLHDEIMAPPGFVDTVMTAIEERKEQASGKKPIYTPMAKGFLCIAAAVLLLVLSMPNLDTAWSALADFSQGLQISREAEAPPAEDDGLMLPGGPALYVSNK